LLQALKRNHRLHAWPDSSFAVDDPGRVTKPHERLFRTRNEVFPADEFRHDGIGNESVLVHVEFETDVPGYTIP